MATMAIPSGVLSSMKIPKKRAGASFKARVGFAPYQRGMLALGPARRLAGISKREFLEGLGKRKIERHYTIEEFEEDLAFARGGL
ncbi:Uncharacterised protein [uncultured archaeon]|nr:Uncharacterised protein [uncultured archaeon]